jgi:hypothetical protein
MVGMEISKVLLLELTSLAFLKVASSLGKRTL